MNYNHKHNGCIFIGSRCIITYTFINFGNKHNNLENTCDLKFRTTCMTYNVVVINASLIVFVLTNKNVEECY